MHVEFWFDLSCPYAYLASGSIEARCRAAGATLDLAPMLLGGVFRDTGAGAGPMASLSAAKAGHNAADMTRWAARLGMPFRMPAHHPARTVRALRTLLGLPGDRWSAAMHALYAAYWQRGEDVADARVIDLALQRAGIDDAMRAEAARRADADDLKAELRRRTDLAVAHGIFGAPAMRILVGDRPAVLLWGQDRLHWLDAVLAGWRPDEGAPPGGPRVAPAAHAAPGRRLEAFLDVASPFAYLASTQLQRVAGTAPLTLRPILLGALFRSIGTADVPWFTMPEAKRRYVGLELDRWARWWGVPWRFPSRFPQRTVTAQRLLLLAGEAAWPLLHALMRAMWVLDRSVEDRAVLVEACADAGVDAALVDATEDPATKAALRDATAAAEAAGVFGVPTMIVHGAGAPQLFWGQDRLELVAEALA